MGEQTPARVVCQCSMDALLDSASRHEGDDGGSQGQGRPVSGQMAVELAVLMPVIVVVALAAYNLGRFVMLCAAFDRVSVDAVLTQGVAPPGPQNDLSCVEEVRACIEEALGAGKECAVEVGVERVGRVAGDAARDGGLSLGPHLSRFTCVLRYRPFPSDFAVAGVHLGAPPALVHERAVVVDRFRSGVVW